MTYPEALHAIEALEPRGWRLGLDRMAEFVRRADLEVAVSGKHPRYIHVAGTNGKGSTTAFLESMLRYGGFRTGAFFSPYVVDYRERIQSEGRLIGEEDLASLTERLMPVAETLSETEFGGVTKFEFEAALGFLYWQERQCDYVALEVGLGGRLDATNVVRPSCSVIVSIGLDHVSILGHTVAEIALEKAGIVKPGVPVVVGQMPAEALTVIEGVARERGAPIWRFGKEIVLEGSRVVSPLRKHEGLIPGIGGSMQPHNLALAVSALDAAGVSLSDGAMGDGAAHAFAPGRMETVSFHGHDLLMDGAHNAEAGSALRTSLDLLYPDRPLHLVTNMLSGHDPVSFYRSLGPRVASVDVCPIDFVRALPVEEAAERLSALFPVVRSHQDVSAALQRALDSTDDGGLVLVTGSNYVVGAVARFINSSR